MSPFLCILMSLLLSGPGAIALRLDSAAITPLQARHVEHLTGSPSGKCWRGATDLCFGVCTSGVQLRIPLLAPRPGRWWWTSELRTPEELRMRLGERELGTFGTARPFRERPAGVLPVAIPLDLRGGPETLFVNASDPQGDVLLEVSFVPDSQFPARLQNHAARDAWLLGFMTMVLLAATYLWWTVRERAFGWYVAYLACALVWGSTKMGFATALLWPDVPLLNHVGPPFFSRICLVFFLLFLRDLLKLRQHFLRLGALLDVLTLCEGLCALFALSSIWVPDFHAAVLRHFVPELFQAPAFLLGLGLVAWRGRRGDGLAKRIALSCLPVVLAAVFGSIWDPLHPDGAANLDTPVAIGGAVLENLFTTWVLAGEVRRRIRAHAELRRDFDMRLEEAYERYRSRVAADLHDNLSQRVMAARIALHLERGTGTEAPSEADAQLQQMAEAVRSLSHQLHPSRSKANNLWGALRELAHSMEGEGFRVELCLDRERELVPTASLELYRIVQEALSNAMRHGEATRVVIHVEESHGGLEVSLCDNGAGMDPDKICEGLGLTNMRERVERLGGLFSLESRRGHGVCLRIRIPSGCILA